MHLEELEVYSEASNFAIIRAKGRRFPGSLVQGDSLGILCEEAKAISKFVQSLKIDNEEMLYLVQEHQEKLLSRLLHYQKVLGEHGIPLPYTASLNDLVVLVPDDEGLET